MEAGPSAARRHTAPDRKSRDLSPTARRLLLAYADAAAGSQDPAISIDRAARLTHESRSSFYRFWIDQADLATAVLEDHLQGFLRGLPETLLETLSRYDTVEERAQHVLTSAADYLGKTRAQHYVARHTMTRGGPRERMLTWGALRSITRGVVALCPTRCRNHMGATFSRVVIATQAIYSSVPGTQSAPSRAVKRNQWLFSDHDALLAAKPSPSLASRGHDKAR